MAKGFVAVNSAPQPLDEKEKAPALRTLKTPTVAMQIKPVAQTQSQNQNQQQQPFLFPQAKSRAYPPLDLAQVNRGKKGKREPPTAPRTHVSNVAEVPTLYPTATEFAKVTTYLSSLHKLGQLYGMVKIVPPQSWKPDLELDTEMLWLESSKQILNQPDAGRAIAESFNRALMRFHDANNTPARFKIPYIDKRPLDLYALHRAVQLRGGFDQVGKKKHWAQVGRDLGYVGKVPSSLSISLRSSYDKIILPFDEYMAQHGVDLAASPKVVRFGILEPGTPPQPNQVVMPNGISVSTDCTNPETTQFPVVVSTGSPPSLEKPAWCHGLFQPKQESSHSPTYTLRQFHQRAELFANSYFKSHVREQQVEAEYWRLLQTPAECLELEAAAGVVPASGFKVPKPTDSKIDPWNFNTLALNRESYLASLDEDVDAIAKPRVEVGMLFATKPWHIQPMLSYLLAFNHMGDTRTWYSVSGEFTPVLASTVGLDNDRYMCAPSDLAKRNLECYCADQRPGELIVVFPKAHTCHFDHGFNIIEKVNLFPGGLWLCDGFLASQLYAQAKIQPPFSIERLVAHIDLSTASVLTLEELAKVVPEIMQREFAFMAQLESLQQKSQQPKDDVLCSSIKARLHYSWVESEDGILAPQVFLDTIKDKESWSKYTYVRRYHPTFLESMNAQVLQKSKEPVDWLRSVFAFLSSHTKFQEQDIRNYLEAKQAHESSLTLPVLNSLHTLMANHANWVACAEKFLSNYKNQIVQDVNELEKLMAFMRNSPIASALVIELNAVAEAYQHFSQSVTHLIRTGPRNYAELFGTVENLLNHGQRLYLDCKELALLGKFREHLVWARQTQEVINTQTCSISQLRSLAQRGQELAIDNNNVVLGEVRYRLSRCEDLEALVFRIIQRPVDQTEPSEIVSALNSAQSIYLRPDLVKKLHEVKACKDVLLAMQSRDPRARPLFGYAREHAMGSVLIGEALMQTQEFQSQAPDWNRLLYQARWAASNEEIPLAEKDIYRVHYDRVVHLCRQVQSLKILPNDFGTILELRCVLDTVTDFNRLQMTGFEFGNRP